MEKLSETFLRFFQHVKESTEGSALLNERNKIWQFEIPDGEDFYLDIRNGNFSVVEGWCELDWKGKDWRTMNVIRVTNKTLEDMMLGRLTPSEAIFDGKMAIASRGNKTETGWLMMLFRTGKEQMEKKGPELILGEASS